VQVHYEVRLYRGKYALYWHDGITSRRRSLGTADRAVALRRKAEIERIETDVAKDTLTVAEVWAVYHKHLTGRPAGATMGFEAKTILPHFGHLMPSSITRAHCEAYMAIRRSAGRKDGAILTELNRLSCALRYGEKHNLISKAPHIARPAAPPPKDIYITKHEAGRLLDVEMPEHLRLFIILALTTGSRAEAIVDLTWDRVDFARKLVDFRLPNVTRPMKQRMICPMNDKLLNALSEAKRKTNAEHVISWGGERIRSVKKSLAQAIKKAGLSPDVTPHVFRHSAAVWLAEAGVDMQVIAQFLGHSDHKVTERIYARYSPSYMRGPVNALDF
jgi:integrase